MSPKLKSNSFRKWMVAGITIMTVIVFAATFFQAGVPATVGARPVASPSYAYNSTVYKYQWMNYTGSSGPAPMSNSTMACFEPTKEVVMFGGQSIVNMSYNNSGKVMYKNTEVFSNQTWTYESGTWSKLTTQSSIPQMAGSSTAYYPRGDSIVLFGGINNGTYFNQTWIFTGLTWTPLKGLTLAPSPRAFTTMAYSPILRGIVLFGGMTAKGYSNSTWLFKDNSWSRLKVNGTAPMAMEGMAASPLPNGNILYYGGYNGKYSNYTYVLNTTSMKWMNISSSNSPPAMAFASLDYFKFNNFTLLYGGVMSNGMPSNSTYIFNSMAEWVNLHIASPSPEYGQAISTYGANNTIVMFGGTMNNTISGYENMTYQFQNNTYNWVLFNENGLPNGSKWGIELGNMYNNTTGEFVGFLVMTGTYNYTVFAPSGYETSSSSGNVTMYFSELQENVGFSKIPGLLYYSYGAIGGIIIVILALVGSEAYRKIMK